MIKLYKDINTINLEYLLEATPFSVVSGKTFSNKLTEKIFFDHIFVPSSTKSLSQQERGKINSCIK